MMMSGTAIVGARVVIGSATSKIETTNLLGGAAAAAAQPGGNNIDGPVNLLLVGIDARPKGSSETAVLADTIVVLHIPASHDQAYLVSIPRDWRVQIPAYPKTGYGGSTEKINSAFSYGYQGGGTELEKRARGVDSLAQTVHSLTGIKFNGAAIIDFAGFESVVKTLGGVNMCVSERAESIHLGIDKKGKIYKLWYKEGVGIQDLPPGAKPVVHEKGCRRMSPELALDYARIRKSLSDGDYGRQNNQQQLIKAIAKEATSKGIITNPLKLNDVIKAAGKAFVLDTQGIPVEDFIFTLRGVAANDLVMTRTNEGKFNTVKIGGVEYQQLTEKSMDMLAAVRDGRLAEFVIANPGFVSKA
ncbi:LCP family protein [Phytohabitans kaempferiae]|uniref:LCP family protein n=1 Tax=Phytohabitans kaempferiae TaxID=1620943 RepID=A0ABV6MF45_9ACTN